MDKQFGATRPAHGESPSGHPQTESASRPTDTFSGRNQSTPPGTAMSAEKAEIDAIQTRINRLLGKPEWNDKQWKSFFALVEERDSLMGRPDWREEVREVIKTLKSSM